MGWLSWLPPLVRYRPEGPYAVAVADLAWCHPTSGPELSPERHLSARVFYPTPRGATFLGGWHRWPLLWLPAAIYARGYATALVSPAKAKGVRAELVRLVLTALIFLLGTTAAIPAVRGAPLLPPLEDSDDAAAADGNDEAKRRRPRQRLPVVVISHGYLGNRGIHSLLATELVSQGFVVVAVEHADGTSSLTRLADGLRPEALPPTAVGRYLFHAPWGPWETSLERTRWRVKELLTAHALLSAMDQGLHVDGLQVSGLPAGPPGLPVSGEQAGIDHPGVGTCLSAPKAASSGPGGSGGDVGKAGQGVTTASFLAGRLDLGRVAVLGHSWGGATAALAASQHPQFVAGVALDPWWKVIPPDSGMLQGRWATPSPLLVLGSHEWNGEPNAKGELPCGLVQRDQAMAAAAHGGGALLLVPKGSTHHSFDDILHLFIDLVAPVLKVFGFHSDLHPRRATDLTARSVLHFLDTHVLAAPAGRRPGATNPGVRPVVPVPFAARHVQPYVDILGADLHAHTLTAPAST